VQVHTWPKNGGRNQYWTLTPEGKIMGGVNNFVLGIGGGKKNRGQPVVTWDDGGPDKFWELTPEGHLQSKWCGLVMGIAGNHRGQGGKIVTWDIDPNWDKVWRFAPHPSDSSTPLVVPDGKKIFYGRPVGVFSESNGKRLDIGSASMLKECPDTHESWATRLHIKPV